MQAYRIKNWSTLYENNRSRELKKANWVPIPNKLDGDGYTLMVLEENGAAMFGAWISLVLLASRCDPRGTLLRSCNLPHDSTSISRITRIPKNIVEKMIRFSHQECMWLETIDLESGEIISHTGAEKSHEGAQNRTEQNGTEQNRKKRKKGKFVSSFCNICLTEYMLLRILENKQITVTDKKVSSWVETFRLMRTIDKRSVNDIYLMMKECYDMPPRPNGFTWATNILSPSKLREKWNDGKIFIGMNTKNNYNSKLDPQELYEHTMSIKLE